MFCPECGSKNPEGLTNCSCCGALLEDNQPTRKNLNEYLSSLKSFLKNRVMPFIKKRKIIIIPLVGVVILAIVFLRIGSAVTSPEHIVDKYVKSLISSDWSSAYQFLDLEENDFVNYEQFVTYQENNTFDCSDIKNYKVIEQDGYKVTEQDGMVDLVRTYEVLYVTSGASSENSFTIKLIEQDEKSWLFYPSYKIATDDMLGTFFITTVIGTSAKIDDIDITGYQEQNDSGYTVFTIPSLFKGSHTLELMHPLCEDYETQIYVENSTNTSNEYGDTIIPLCLKQEEIASLASKTEETLKTICNGILSSKDFDSLSIECTSDRSNVNEIKNFYSDLTSYLKNENGTGLKEIKFYSFTDNSQQTIFDDTQTYRCTVNFKYDYTKLEKNWYDDEISESSAEGRTGRITITYVYENDNWVVSSIDDYRLYY